MNSTSHSKAIGRKRALVEDSILNSQSNGVKKSRKREEEVSSFDSKQKTMEVYEVEKNRLILAKVGHQSFWNQ